jgi:uncharacterized protein YdaU (DUF1376 family)
VSELPFMQLYVSDYLGDTRHLSCEQHGAYLLLLMTMWNAHGSLPDDDAKLARMVCLSVKKWRGIRTEVMEFFDVSEGRVTHPRLSRELQKSERQSESRASAGAKGGAAKSLKYKGGGVASAIAGPQHLPEPYRKEGNSNGSPPERLEKVSRLLEPEVFAVLVSLTEPVKDFIDAKSFPAALVAKTRHDLTPPRN